MSIIASTGTQSGMTEWQKQEFSNRLREANCTEFINGGCIGSDEQCFVLALALGIDIFTFYPSNLVGKQNQFVKAIPTVIEWHPIEIMGRHITVRKMHDRPPLERNQTIVDTCSKLIATPKEHAHTLRSGTWTTIRYAWKKQKRDKSFGVLIIPPVDRVYDESERESN